MPILAKKKLIRNSGYSLPDILKSYESFLHAHNLDLPEVESFSLKQELFKIAQAKAYIEPQRQQWLFLGPGKFIPAVAWLEKREAAIKAELKRRRAEA